MSKHWRRAKQHYYKDGWPSTGQCLLKRLYLIFLALLVTESASYMAPRPCLFHCQQRKIHKCSLAVFHLRNVGQNNDTSRSRCPALYAQNTDDTIILSSPVPPLTSALLKISFDGRRFTGWSASNDPKPGERNVAAISKKAWKRDRLQRGSKMEPRLKGYVRSVQGVLRGHLAKIYGNLDPQQIVVEGCSRTDKGVHARSMMAMIYGLHNDCSIARLGDTLNEGQSTSPVAGIGKVHPQNATDASSFLPVPMDLPKLAFALNRMLPPDIRIAGIAPIPSVESPAVFHPSLSTVTKTYVYAFSIGSCDDNTRFIPDPTARRWVWHTPTNGGGREFQSQHGLDMEKMEEACRILQGTHDFSSFQGAPRGATDRLKRQQAPKDHGVCTLESILVKELPKEDCIPSPPTSTQYVVEVVGDRFLYKMVRFLVGALVDIGLSKNGSMDLESLKNDLLGNPAHQNSARSFSCAPAHGLVLHSVDYGVDIDWQLLRN